MAGCRTDMRLPRDLLRISEISQHDGLQRTRGRSTGRYRSVDLTAGVCTRRCVWMAGYWAASPEASGAACVVDNHFVATSLQALSTG